MNLPLAISSIVARLERVPAEADAAMLIRHAEREAIPPDNFGADVSLTDFGTRSAKRLGALLSEKREFTVTSSPVRRCVQTAEAILRGAGKSDGPRLDQRLGDPGPFVIEPEVSGPLFLQLDIQELVRCQLTQTEPLPGMRPTEDGVEILLGLMVDGLAQHGRLNLYVTHDAIMAVLVCQLLKLPLEDVGWPDYLDGLVLGKSSGHINYSWKGS